VRQRDLANLQKGIRMCTLYSEDARGGAGMHAWVGEMTAAGAEIRTTDHEYPRMIIIDRRVAVIPGDDDLTARIIHDAGVATFLADHLFGSCWAQARPWIGVLDPQQPLERERQYRVMALMDDGLTLQEIAKRLHISQRRLATIVAELKAAYGATSLFQLGSRWRAARQAEAAAESTLVS
jgi:AraC-like DNA-binding protein